MGHKSKAVLVHAVLQVFQWRGGPEHCAFASFLPSLQQLAPVEFLHFVVLVLVVVASCSNETDLLPPERGFDGNFVANIRV